MATDRFVHEFELAPTPQQARILRIRLDLGRQIYNAFLGKAKARLHCCRRDARWREAARLSRAGNKHAARALYREVERHVIRTERLRHAPDFAGEMKTARLTDPASGIMSRLRQAHFRDHLDFKSVQDMATRAYRTVDRVRFLRPTRRKDGSLTFPKAHFLPKGEVRAINSTSIHWRGNMIEWNSPLHRLQIPVRFDRKDKRGIQAHALRHMRNPANICESIRVLRRTIRGEERFFCQITIKGHALWREAQYPPGHGRTVGIDVGPSQIGICYEAPDGTLQGDKLELVKGLRHDYVKIRRLQRYLDRSRRTMNPDNYNPDGTMKRTHAQRRVWHTSQRYRKAKTTLADLWRAYAARRHNALGKLANQIIAMGITIKIEDLHYTSWQRQWGKSIGRGAPGLLVAMLRRKAAQVGGALIEFPTRHTKFSQLCHGCGAYKKKSLSQRTHTCECGIGPIDRDIYSAFLAYHYDFASKTLDMKAARATFGALQCPAVGVQGLGQAASAIPSQGTPSSLVAGEDQSGFSAKRALVLAEDSGEVYPEERLKAIPTFQDSMFSADAASVEAGMPRPGDARMLQPQENGH